jgi:hypothetical protein
MEYHVFAVWDFMTVVKRLQYDLTSLHPDPWTPGTHPIATRLINEIVLGEESDEVEPGRYMSHYELYVEAMREAGADPAPVERFTAQLREGERPRTALARLPVADSIQSFVRHTLDLVRAEPHEVAACFVYGREDPIPEMFTRLRRTLDGDDRGTHVRDRVRTMTGREQEGSVSVDSAESDAVGELPYERLRLYLERHIANDREEHGSMAKHMLMALCGTDERRWQEAEVAAKKSIAARIGLWNGVMAAHEQISPSNLPADAAPPQPNLH